MNFRKIISLVVATVALAACGGGSDGPPSKNLFSTWERVPDGAYLDLRNAQFSTPSFVGLATVDVGWCQCVLNIAGDQISGSFAVSSCSPVGGTTLNQCRTLETVGLYTNRDSLLSITDGQGQIQQFR